MSLWRHSRLTYYDLSAFWHNVWNCWSERYGQFQSETVCSLPVICGKPQRVFGPPELRFNLRPNLCFSTNNSQNTGNFALKLGMPLRITMSHIVSKSQIGGHNGSAVSDVRMTLCFADFDKQQGFKETLSRAQFLRYDQSSSIKVTWS